MQPSNSPPEVHLEDHLHPEVRHPAHHPEDQGRKVVHHHRPEALRPDPLPHREDHHPDHHHLEQAAV